MSYSIFLGRNMEKIQIRKNVTKTFSSYVLWPWHHADWLTSSNLDNLQWIFYWPPPPQESKSMQLVTHQVTKEAPLWWNKNKKHVHLPCLSAIEWVCGDWLGFGDRCRWFCLALISSPGGRLQIVVIKPECRPGINSMWQQLPLFQLL